MQIRHSLETCVRALGEIDRIDLELNSNAGSVGGRGSELAIPGDAFVALELEALHFEWPIILTIIRAFAKVREAIPESV